MKGLVELELSILELDEELKPIAKKLVDLGDPNWMDKLQKTSPIDQKGRDSRDAILSLRNMVAAAKDAKLDTLAICRNVASLSSDIDRYGMGSTRSMLLREN
jgi:hypothetical protein